MENSPEYQHTDSHDQYFVTTSDSEEAQQSYEVPEMHFPKGTKISFVKGPNTEGENVANPQESLEQEGSLKGPNTGGETSENQQEPLTEAANEVIDDELRPNPEDKVMAMAVRLDSQEENSLSNLEKKGKFASIHPYI